LRRQALGTMMLLLRLARLFLRFPCQILSLPHQFDVRREWSAIRAVDPEVAFA